MNVETIADIVAEMREYAQKWAKDPESAKILEKYADRIDDATECE